MSIKAKVFSVLTLALLSVLLGCSAAPDRALRIRPGDFTPEQEEVIVRAAERWVAAIPEHRFPVSVGEPATIVLVPWKGQEALARAAYSYIEIFDRPETLDVNLEHIVLHELGHFLGAHGEHAEPVGVMYDKWGPETCISAQDIEFVCEQIGCSDDTFPEC